MFSSLKGTSSPRELKNADAEELAKGEVADGAGFRFSGHGVGGKVGGEGGDKFWGGYHMAEGKELRCKIIEGSCLIVNGGSDRWDVQDTNSLTTFAQRDGQECEVPRRWVWKGF